MSEQRKFEQRDEPSVDLHGETGPAVSANDVEAAETQMSLEPTRLEPDTNEFLPPLPTKNLPPPRRIEEADQSNQSHQASNRLRRLSAGILILMTGSLAGFITGATAGIFLFTGILDLDSQWIKSVVDMFRG